MIKTIRRHLQEIANDQVAASTARFFKTGKGQYAESSRFIGITVPELRKTAKSYLQAPFETLLILLNSPIHEEKHLSLMILRHQFEKGDPLLREKIFAFYKENTCLIDNWDLVDGSAPAIVGGHLFEKDKTILYHLAQSSNLWERRIAIVSTQYFIRKGHFKETLSLAEMLLSDTEDLIHKATGWMLREVGKKDTQTLESFLKIHVPSMPRTMLRYAIEHFPKEKRGHYMNAKDQND